MNPEDYEEFGDDVLYFDYDLDDLEIEEEFYIEFGNGYEEYVDFGDGNGYDYDDDEDFR